MKLLIIFTGWAKWLFGIQSDYSEARMAICKVCPEAVPKKLLRIINGADKWEDSLQCTICKCPCLEKSLVESEKCPLKKWQ